MYRWSSSGRKLSDAVSAVAPAALSSSLSPRPVKATRHILACRQTVIASMSGRSGPSQVLKPAQPNEKTLRRSCSAQHEEERRPITDHHSIRCDSHISQPVSRA